MRLIQLFCVLALSLATTAAFAQSGKISGTVTDAETGSPLPGVNVTIEGTTQGAATDAKGEYAIAGVEVGVYTVHASFVGYAEELKEDIEVQENETTTVNFVMQQEATGLDEVVVVGYGEQQEANVIGSVAQVSSEDLESIPVPNISNALAGRLPGLTVQQRNGEPGNNDASLLIRGNSTFNNNGPLVVVDGVQGRSLNSLNPNDIKSISVLKDASAAIYGANAANGVILVTTKSGRRDTEPTFTYQFYQGFQTPTKLPDMADAATYARMIRETQQYRGIPEESMTYSEADIKNFESGEYPWTHPNTDWYEAALSDFAPTANHNVTVYGGTSRISYYGSLSASFEEGIYKRSATDYERYSLRAKTDVDINDYVAVGVNISASKENIPRSAHSADEIYATLVRMLPTTHALYPNTDKPGMDLEYGLQPLVSPSTAPGFDRNQEYTSYNKLSAELKMPGVDGLTLDGYYAYDKIFTKGKRLMRPFTLYAFDETAYLEAGNTGKENGSDFLIPAESGTVQEPQVTDEFGTITNTTFNLKVAYNNTLFESHNISAFAAYEHHNFNEEGISAFRRYFKTDQLPYLFAGGNDQKDNDAWVGLDGSVNYISRLSYNYNQTYYVQGSFRRDGSLRFSEEHGRWGNFPSVLVGWRPSNYSWWQTHLPYINDFKLRGSYGRMGNDEVPAWQYLSSFEFGTGVVTGGSRTYSQGLYQSNTPNPGITWEVGNMYNFGWDARLLDYRVIFNADLFYERRSDILIKRNASVPQFTGLQLPDENFGIVDSKGFEVVLGYEDQGEDFAYGARGNFSFAHNTIVEMDEPARNVPWQVRTGYPMGAALVYKSAGIFSDWDEVESLPHLDGARPGDIVIEDVNGDGAITTDDRILLHQTDDPEINYGLSLNFSYKNWQLRGLIQGAANRLVRMYQETRQGQSGNYFQYDAEGRWTPDNKNASKPRAFIREEEYWRGSHITDYMYRDGSFARLKNLSLHYGVPDRFLSYTPLTKGRIYFSGQNLFLLYNSNPMKDPEVASTVTYPLMRVVSIGMEISF